MSDFGIQGEVVLDSSKAESAFDRVGNAAEQMSREVAGAADKAGQAVDKIGDGTTQAVEKFTRGEAAIVASARRSTEALQLLGKTASEKLEFKIDSKGFDRAKFEPALQALREVEAQAERAQAAATGSLNKMGVSAGQTQAALRQLPAQFSDIVVSLQAGQAPLTVFLQQGAQIKDSFGGAGEAVKAMGGYVMGLVNPFTLAAVAVAGLGLAYNQGSKEADEYRKTIALTGNAAGTTVGQLQQMAQQIALVTGSQREAAGALATFASSGKVGADNLRQFTQAAVEFGRVTGQSVDEVAKNFAELAKEPLTATIKLNESMNYLTEATFRQIQSLQEQGRETEAANLAQKTYADTLNERKDDIVRNLGTIEKAWIAIKKEAGYAMDALLDIGRAKSLETQLTSAQNALDSYRNTLPGRRTTEQVKAIEGAGGEAAVEGRIAGLKDLIENQRKSAQMERERGEAVRASGELAKGALKYESDLEKQRREVLAATQNYEIALAKGNLSAEQRNKLERDYLALVGGITAVKEKAEPKGRAGKSEETKDLEARAKLLAELSGLSSSFYADWEVLQKAFKAGALSVGEMDAKVAQLVAKQPFAIAQAKEQGDALKAQQKIIEEATKSYTKYIEELERSVNAVEQQVGKMQTEEEAAAIAAEGYYSLAEAIEMVTIKRLEEKRDGLLGNEAALLAVQKEIDARKELMGLIGKKEERKAAEDAAKETARDWQRTAEDVNRSLTDALLRGFESGKGFAENFRDTVKNMFSTLVLRPVISGILAPVSGALASVFGGPAAAGQAGGAGGIGGLGGLVNAGSTLYSALTNGISSSISAGFSKFALSGTGQSLGLSSAVATNAGPGLALTNTGSALGTGLGMLGSGLAGYGLSSLVSGGYSLGGKNTVNVLSGIASAFLGPLAGLAGGLVNRLFGRKLKDVGIEGTLGGSAGFDGQSFQYYKGGLFRSDKTTYSDLDPETESGIANSFKAIQAQVGTFATILGLNADKVATFTTQLKFSTQGLDEAGIQEAFAEALRTGSNELAQQVLGTWTQTSEEVTRVISQSAGRGMDDIATTYDTVTETITKTTYAASQFAKDGEEAIDTLTRLATSFTTVNEASDALGYGFQQASLSAAAFASNVIDAFGGLEQFSQQMGQYLSNYYTDEEQRDSLARRASQAFGGVGITVSAEQIVNATRPQVRAFVEMVKEEFGADSEQYATAVQQANALAGIYEPLPSAIQPAVEATRDFTTVVDELTQKFKSGKASLLGEADDLAVARLRAEGDEPGARALERQQFLNSFRDEAGNQLDASRLKEIATLYDANQATKDYIQGIKDAAQAQLDALDKLRASSLEQIDTAAGKTDRALAAYERAADKERERLQGVIDDVRSVFDAAKEGSRSLFDEVDAVVKFQGAEGRDFITRALAQVQAGGALPDGKDLSEAIAAVGKDFSTTAFASQAEADFQRLVVANELKGLQDVSGDQLTEAERQLDELEEQTRWAREQVDALRGIDSSVGTLSEAIQDLIEAYNTEAQTRANVGAKAIIGTGSAIYDKATGAGKTSSGAYFDAADMAEIARDVIAANGAAGKASVLDALQGQGFTMAQYNEMFGLPAGTLEAEAKALGKPIYHSGTTYVPETGFALLQQGEAVIPAAYNPWANGVGGSGNDGAVVAELRLLRDDNRAQAGQIIRLQAQVAKLLNQWNVEGLPEERELTL